MPGMQLDRLSVYGLVAVAVLAALGVLALNLLLQAVLDEAAERDEVLRIVDERASALWNERVSAGAAGAGSGEEVEGTDGTSEPVTAG